MTDEAIASGLDLSKEYGYFQIFTELTMLNPNMTVEWKMNFFIAIRVLVYLCLEHYA